MTMKVFVEALLEAIRHLVRGFEGLSRSITEGMWDASKSLAMAPTAIADAISQLLVPTQTIRSPRRASFEDRFDQLTQSLRKSGSDAQALIEELERVLAARHQQMQEAQERMAAMEGEESAMRERLEALSAIEPEAATAINSLLDESLDRREQRMARRDWVLVGIGALLSAAVSLFFFLLG